MKFCDFFWLNIVVRIHVCWPKKRAWKGSWNFLPGILSNFPQISPTSPPTQPMFWCQSPRYSYTMTDCRKAIKHYVTQIYWALTPKSKLHVGLCSKKNPFKNIMYRVQSCITKRSKWRTYKKHRCWLKNEISQLFVQKAAHISENILVVELKKKT